MAAVAKVEVANVLAKTIALAIFAKTPSLSAVKTRLAADIGVERARLFYQHSLASIKDIVAAVQRESYYQWIPYWALAEEEALHAPYWEHLSFPNLWTGEGELGQRLHTIYSALQQHHAVVVVIGSDSPQLEPCLFHQAIAMLSSAPAECVVGPCFDGGFYLFAGAGPIPRAVWVKVCYSQKTTLQALKNQLSQHSIGVSELAKQFDVDIKHDLHLLVEALKGREGLLPAQRQLLACLVG